MSSSTSTVNTTPMEKRIANFSVIEDCALCMAWLSHSNDGVTGKNHRGVELWNKVFADYQDRVAGKPDTAERDIKKIRVRWNTIRGDVEKYCACVDQIQNTEGQQRQQQDIIRGEDIADIERRAGEMYQREHRKKFGLKHCYRALSSHPCWISRLAGLKSPQKKRALITPARGTGDTTHNDNKATGNDDTTGNDDAIGNGDATSNDDPGTDDTGVDNAGIDATSNDDTDIDSAGVDNAGNDAGSSSLSRPQRGHKKNKEAEKQLQETVPTFLEMLQSQQKVLIEAVKAKEKRAQDYLDFKYLTTDISKILDPRKRRCLEFIQLRACERIEASADFPSSSIAIIDDSDDSDDVDDIDATIDTDNLTFLDIINKKQQ